MKTGVDEHGRISAFNIENAFYVSPRFDGKQTFIMNFDMQFNAIRMFIPAGKGRTLDMDGRRRFSIPDTVTQGVVTINLDETVELYLGRHTYQIRQHEGEIK